jgi:hypothetical protein
MTLGNGDPLAKIARPPTQFVRKECPQGYIEKLLMQKSHDTLSLKVCGICSTCTPLGLFCRAFRSEATRVKKITDIPCNMKTISFLRRPVIVIASM